MRFSNSTGRLNPNLLYSPFKKVEEYEKDTQDIKEIEKKYTHRKTPSLSLKKRSSRKHIEIPQVLDDFNNLSLERQVEVMMRPITNPGKKAENLLRLMEDEEHSKHSSKETEKLTLETDDFEINSRFGGRNILQEIKYQSSSVKATKSAKESISLPPLKDNDPLFTTQTAKHWHYHEPIKHTPRNLRGSINNIDMSSSMQKPTMETKFSGDKSKIFFSQSKSRLKTKNLAVLNSEVSVQRTFDSQNTSSTSRFHRHREISLSTKRKQISNENLFANVTPNNNKTSRLLGKPDDPNMFYIEGITDLKGVHNAQQTSNDVNHLLNVIPVSQDSQLGGKILDFNQIRTQNLQNSKEKRSSRLGLDEDILGLSTSKMDMSKMNLLNGSKLLAKGLTPQTAQRKGAQTPSKKKEYYNRWFVPVKFWKEAKERGVAEKKIEEIKKDTHYFYHNLHNYASQPSSHPNQDQAKKTELQINYENVQEKLKQNMVIKKYKKQLADNGERIPNFLKNIEEDIGTTNK